MSGARHRLEVTTLLRDGRWARWVSPKVLHEDEACLAVAEEAFLHSLCGWRVEFPGDGCIAVCFKGGTRRLIVVLQFHPLTDNSVGIKAT